MNKKQLFFTLLLSIVLSYSSLFVIDNILTPLGFIGTIIMYLIYWPFYVSTLLANNNLQMEDLMVYFGMIINVAYLFFLTIYTFKLINKLFIIKKYE